MSEDRELREALEVRAQYHALEEFQRPLFIVQWLDKRVSELEATLAAHPAGPSGTVANTRTVITDAVNAPQQLPAGRDEVEERTQASCEAFEAWLTKALEDGEPSYHEAWDAGERFAADSATRSAPQTGVPQQAGGGKTDYDLLLNEIRSRIAHRYSEEKDLRRLFEKLDAILDRYAWLEFYR